MSGTWLAADHTTAHDTMADAAQMQSDGQTGGSEPRMDFLVLRSTPHQLQGQNHPTYAAEISISSIQRKQVRNL